jgi:hypothetical protein
MPGYLGSKAVLLSTTAANVTGNASITGDLTVDTNTLFVDSANNRVGVGTVSPSVKLHLGGTAPLDSIIRQDSTLSGTNWEIGEREAGKWQIWEDDGDTIVATFQSNGRLGIGTTAPENALHLANASGPFIVFQDNDAGSNKPSIGTEGTSGSLIYNSGGTSASHIFKLNRGASEAMRIDSSGNVLVGTTTNTGSSRMLIQVDGSGGNGITTLPDVDATYTPMVFRRGNGTTVGTISSTTTSTAYNTSSDYRLKEDVQPMVDATDRVLALKPVNFAWKVDGTRVDGFLAHEAQEVVPEAVTGAKDAMRDEEYEVTPAVYEDVIVPAVLDDDGNEIEPERTEQRLVSEAVMGTRQVPDYQGIDQSKLVPLLTAALQEALTEIAALKDRVAALEGN